jgi:predicted nucleic acid-binding protein
VVPDPGVLISAAISEKGAPWEVLRRWMAGGFDLVVSPRLLHELQSVLARGKFRRYLTYEDATEHVSWLHHEAEVVRDPAESVIRGAVEADPDDEYLVGLAGPWDAATPTFCQSTATYSTSRIGPSKTAKGTHWLIS